MVEEFTHVIVRIVSYRESLQEVRSVSMYFIVN